MLKHYLKIALRHLKRQQMVTMINVVGLAIAMACCILIVLFIRSEYSYDNFHADRQHIYRVTSIFYKDGQGHEMGKTQFPVAPVMKAELPAVKAAVRITDDGQDVVAYGNKKVLERLAYADQGYLTMFNFPLKEGNPVTALKDPYTMVISEEIAHKYFGNEDPVGKVFKIENKFDCQVTGVLKTLPKNTDIGYDIVMSFNTIKEWNLKSGYKMEQEWMGFGDNTTYVQLASNTDMAAFDKAMKNFADRHVKKIANSLGQDFYFGIQPLSHVHLHPRGDTAKPDQEQLIYIYMAIALFVILIAAFNFMNLVTARANERAVEVGLRKVMGSEKRSLVLQFLTEAVLLSLLAFVLSIIFTLLAMPVFERITGKTLSVLVSENVPFLLQLLGLAVVVGLFTGCYPAFYLSSFLPVVVMKGGFQSSGSRAFVRKGLVVTQFAIAIILVSATIVVYAQLRYWQTRYLGFDKEGLVNIYLPSDDSGPHVGQLLKEELLRQPAVKSVTQSDMAMGRFINRVNPVAKEGDPSSKSVTGSIITGDFDLVKTLDIKLLQGRNFSPELATDSNDAFIVNEAMVKAMNLKDPIGARIEWRPGFTVRKGTIIGVSKDFNYASLAIPVDPAIYFIDPKLGSVLNIRLAKGDIHAAMLQLEAAWKKVALDQPFQYSFVDDDLAKQYTSESGLATLFAAFSGLAIIIACMGLFGLSILIARQRTKEIGIRKVLGASAGNITVLLSRDFMQLVLLSILFALPVSWYLMYRWLQDFAFRINLQWWMFVSAGVVALLIALFTISFQSVRAAMMNPVKSLRTE